MIAQTFLDESRRYLKQVYLDDIERAIAPLSDEQIWWRPNEASNSIGNLILHLSGNVRQWIVGGVGLQPNSRNRQLEFDQRSPIQKEEILSRLRTIIDEADAVIGAVSESTLEEAREIQDRNTTVLKAIYHVVEHFATHTGQIQWISKSLASNFRK